MTALGRPPRAFNALKLATVEVQTSRLVRVSRYTSGEPHFGQSASNRFDDPSSPAKGRFGTCYFGLNLKVAIAEIILHDEMPKNGQFKISADEVESRYVVSMKGRTLVLANFTGTALKTLVGDSSISTITPYKLPQAWARAVHRHPASVDGILYVSRHVNDEKAIVLFDRAAPKLFGPKYKPLMANSGALSAVMELHISFDYT
jgi:hypothetical protein